MAEVRRLEKGLDEKIEEVKKKIIEFFKNVEVLKDYSINFYDVVLNVEKGKIKVAILIKERAYAKDIEINEFLKYHLLLASYLVLRNAKNYVNDYVKKIFDEDLIERLKEERNEKHYIKIEFGSDIFSTFEFRILHVDFELESPFLFRCGGFYVSLFNKYREFLRFRITSDLEDEIKMMNNLRKDEIEELREFLKYCYSYIMISKI